MVIHLDVKCSFLVFNYFTTSIRCKFKSVELFTFVFMIFFFLVLVIVFLAYANGANDNFKGVATLFGSKTSEYKGALWWATISTFAGSVAAIFLATALVKNFSGKGLVPDQLVQTPSFAFSIALGASLTVFLATRIGMPISTTHAIVGSLVGSGIVAVGMNFNFEKLVDVFMIPLLLSPMLALFLSLIAYLIFRKMRHLLGVTKKSCLCIGSVPTSEAQLCFEEDKFATIVQTHSTVQIAEENECLKMYEGTFLGIKAQNLLDSLHFFSAGIVSFARGLNDTPKIAGLLLVFGTLDLRLGLFILGIAMAIGGLINAEKVAETMSNKIVSMNHGQGFTANLITGILVTTASIHGLPVSTTHVSVGSIFGIGTVNGNADLKTIRNIVLSWVLTLPIACLFGATSYWFSKGLI